ncbi:MAG: hypothetical protein HZB29_01475 [Nitrospinae bacterium]|nr:hypothetical protein [Nitrospinota bacterium]
MELVYIQVFLEENRVLAWSSHRGPLNTGGAPWRHIFKAPGIRPVEQPARVMIHLAGDFESVTSDERMMLLDTAQSAGYGVARIETGEPLLEPEEAYGLLLVPFT